MSTVIVLIVAVVLIGFILYWSSRHGVRRSSGGTSLRRGPNAHTTSTGRTKVSYATRDDALSHARQLTGRDGQRMNVYQCATCAKWHVGHGR